MKVSKVCVATFWCLLSMIRGSEGVEEKDRENNFILGRERGYM